ncbi:MAG: 50S ribosomal protein L22 [Phycisphaerales bacterium]
MRIHGPNLKRLAGDKGVEPERLAEAVQRTGLKGANAVRAVSNWMRDNDHPRCKASDIGKMAEVLGVESSKIARFECILKYQKGSPRKAKLLTDLIRGKDVLTAENLLRFNTKRAAVGVFKALKAAIADAEQAQADATALVVCDSRVDGGPVMKRIKEKDRGRAHPILKPFSHITVALEERV